MASSWASTQAHAFAFRFDAIDEEAAGWDASMRESAMVAVAVGEAAFFKALVSGAKEVAEAGIAALDRSLAVAEAQRSGRLERVPLVGGVLSWLATPVTSRLPKAAPDVRSKNDEGAAAGALLYFYRGALRALTGALARAALDLRRSYVGFYAIPEDTPSADASSLRRVGIGAFSAFLSFAPLAVRVTFGVLTATAIQAGGSHDEGLDLVMSARDGDGFAASGATRGGFHCHLLNFGVV